MYKFIPIIDQFVDKKIDFLLNGINGTKMNNKNKAMFKFIPIIDQLMDKNTVSEVIRQSCANWLIAAHK